jgi:ATP-dependent DNA helicase RecG
LLIATSPNILAHPIEYLKGVGPQRADLLKKELAIFTFADLLHHFPYRHVDKTKVTEIIDLNPSVEFAQVRGKLWYYETTGEKSAKRLVAYLKDNTGVIELTWFKGITWVERLLKQDEAYFAFGKISFFMGKPQIVHPELESIQQQVAGKSFLEPVYPTTEKLKGRGLGGRQLGKLTEALFALLRPADLPENLPENILTGLKLTDRYEAFRSIHFPPSPAAFDAAVRRLKFEELFITQLRLAMVRSERHRKSAGVIF